MVGTQRPGVASPRPKLLHGPLEGCLARLEKGPAVGDSSKSKARETEVDQGHAALLGTVGNLEAVLDSAASRGCAYRGHLGGSRLGQGESHMGVGGAHEQVLERV